MVRNVLYSMVLRIMLFVVFCGASVKELRAENPDTVSVGIYITSVHDIDFRQKEYAINFWLWFRYNNPDFNFLQNVEVPQAKSINKSYAINDTIDGKMYTLMKVQCVMKDSWKIKHFPFDRQTLRLSIENAQFDMRDLVFVADTMGKPYDQRIRTFMISGWNIDSFTISTDVQTYETTFGDETLSKPEAQYSSFKIKFGLKRNAWGLFLKIFLGMYVAFFIAYVCFYIHADNIDSRFGVSVGALFAAIGNKYVVDSSLPESSSFTLVDTLHGITLFFIFLVIAASAYALKLTKEGKPEKANRIDMIGAQSLLIIYIAINVIYITRAVLS